jgi:hypothetical protein
LLIDGFGAPIRLLIGLRNPHRLSCISSMPRGSHLFYQALVFCHICFAAMSCTQLFLCCQDYLAICRYSHSKPLSSANNLSDSQTSLLFFNRVLLCNMMDSTFSISSSTDRMTFIGSWNVLFTSGLLSWVALLF